MKFVLHPQLVSNTVERFRSFKEMPSIILKGKKGTGRSFFSQEIRKRLEPDETLRVVRLSGSRLASMESLAERCLEALGRLGEWGSQLRPWEKIRDAVAESEANLLLIIDDFDRFAMAQSSSDLGGFRNLFSAESKIGFLGTVVEGWELQTEAVGTDDPLFRLFEVYEIPPLSAEALTDDLLSWARSSARPRLAELLANRPEYFQALLDLLGTAPQTIVLVLENLERSETKSVPEYLSSILDSPDLERELEALFASVSDRQRQLLTALGSSWEPLKEAELQERAQIDRRVSTELSRLVDRGILDRSKGQYQINDPAIRARLLLDSGSTRRLYQTAQRHFAGRSVERLTAPRRTPLCSPPEEVNFSVEVPDTVRQIPENALGLGSINQFNLENGTASKYPLVRLIKLCDREEFIEALAVIEEALIDQSCTHLHGRFRALYGYLMAATSGLSDGISNLALAGESHPSAPVCNQLGDLYMRSGNYTEAKKAFQRAKQLDRKDVYSHCALAKISLHEGNFQESATELSRALSIDAGCLTAWSQYALLLRSVGETNRYEKLMRRLPGGAVAVDPHLLMRVLEESILSDDPSAAIEFATETRSAKPHFWWLRFFELAAGADFTWDTQKDASLEEFAFAYFAAALQEAPPQKFRQDPRLDRCRESGDYFIRLLVAISDRADSLNGQESLSETLIQDLVGKPNARTILVCRLGASILAPSEFSQLQALPGAPPSNEMPSSLWLALGKLYGERAAKADLLPIDWENVLTLEEIMRFHVEAGHALLSKGRGKEACGCFRYARALLKTYPHDQSIQTLGEELRNREAVLMRGNYQMRLAAHHLKDDEPGTRTTRGGFEQQRLLGTKAQLLLHLAECTTDLNKAWELTEQAGACLQQAVRVFELEPGQKQDLSQDLNYLSWQQGLCVRLCLAKPGLLPAGQSIADLKAETESTVLRALQTNNELFDESGDENAWMRNQLYLYYFLLRNAELSGDPDWFQEADARLADAEKTWRRDHTKTWSNYRENYVTLLLERYRLRNDARSLDGDASARLWERQFIRPMDDLVAKLGAIAPFLGFAALTDLLIFSPEQTIEFRKLLESYLADLKKFIKESCGRWSNWRSGLMEDELEETREPENYFHAEVEALSNWIENIDAGRGAILPHLISLQKKLHY